MKSGHATRYSLRVKLVFAFAALMGITTIIGWRGVAGMNRSWARMRAVFDTTFEVNLRVARANVSLIQWNRAVLHHVLSTDPDELAAQERNIALHERRTLAQLEALSNSTVPPGVAEGAQKVAEKYRSVIPLKDRVISLSGSGRQGEAYGLVSDELRPRVDALIMGMDSLVELKRQDVILLTGQIDADMRRDIAVIVAFLGVALAASAVVAYGLSSSILRSAGELVRGARLASKGELASARVELPEGDEFGYVGGVFNDMIANLEKALAEEKAAVTELARHRDHLEELVAARTSELDAQWRRLLDILRNFPEMVYVIDPETHEILFVNRTMENRFGCTIVGMKCFEALMGSSSPCSFCKAIGLLKGVDTHVWETHLPSIDRDLVITDQRAKWIDGRTVRLELAVDITERKEAERRLESALRELERSNRELEQFAYMASHDLQEPLRMVSSYTQLLARRYKGRLDADADDFIGFAVDGAARMQRLINDLLAYSRVSTRGCEPEPVDSRKALDEAMVNLRASIEESSAVITAVNLPTVRFDPTQLVQVFQNLIGNAIKFLREGEAPRVFVTAEKKTGEWLFAVRDNGIGIAPEFHERVFTIFQRLHGRGRYPGTGIGLALCRRIVERQGGRIWVESVEGEGSTFFFTIPEGEAHE